MNLFSKRTSCCLMPNKKSGRLIARQAISGLAVLTVLCIPLPGTIAQQSGPLESQSSAEVNANELLDLLGQVYLTLEAHHYSPPTGQQFALTAARVIREQSGQMINRTMKSEVEELVTADDLRKWLTNEVESAKQSNRKFNVDEIVNRTVQSFNPDAIVVSSKEAKVRDQLRDNRYVGIGIRVSYTNGFAIIDEPFPGGAAKIAGAKPGDIILEVDDKSMSGLDLRQVVDVLRGDIDTRVSVVVRNEKETESRRLDMVRTVIPIPSVEGVSQNDDGSWEFADPNAGQPAQIRLSGIVGSTASELADAARKIRSAAIKNIVLDLRQVIDCDLHHAHIVADTLTGEGTFAVVIDGEGKTQEMSTRDECDFDGFRIAVLLPEKVSGPVMAVLCRLDSMPNVATVGTEVRSDLRVLGSFDFPDGSGSISGINFARIDSHSLNSKGSRNGDAVDNMGRAPSIGSQLAVLKAKITAEDQDRFPLAALETLMQNDH